MLSRGFKIGTSLNFPIERLLHLRVRCGRQYIQARMGFNRRPLACFCPGGGLSLVVKSQSPLQFKSRCGNIILVMPFDDSLWNTAVRFAIWFENFEILYEQSRQITNLLTDSKHMTALQCWVAVADCDWHWQFSTKFACNSDDDKQVRGISLYRLSD